MNALHTLDMGKPVPIVELAHTLIKLSGIPEKEVEIAFTGYPSPDPAGGVALLARCLRISPQNLVDGPLPAAPQPTILRATR